MKFVPMPVVTGFTAGIAVIIASSQVGDFLGLDAGKVPAEFLGKWEAYLGALDTLSQETALIGLGTLALILILKKVNPRLPGYLIGIVVASAAVSWLALPAGHPFRFWPVESALAFRSRFLEWGLISASELDQLLQECERIARDPDTFLTSFGVMQVWGRKPESG